MKKFKIIDVHTHLWKGKYEEDIVELRQAMERHSIDRIVISALYSYSPSEAEVDELNAHVTDAVRRYPDQFSGYVYLNPFNANCMDVLKRGVEEDGAVGVKLWVASYCDDPAVNPIFEKCIDYNIPILLHSFIKTVDQLPNETVGTNVHNIALRYPESKIIMAHLGANCYHGVKAIRNDKNVSVDMSGSIYRRDDLDYTVSQVGTDRIVFGTDMTGSYNTNYGQILEADITDSQRADILSGNAEKLFRF
ncbi:MAG: amidohydrolase family protein [Oscillospiraceae bacterium]|nr:amidohydrolase family protein [Oscillospiraceae bacterium]